MTTLFPQIKRVDEDETSKIIKNVLFNAHAQDEKLEKIFDEFMHLTKETITISDYDDDDDIEDDEDDGEDEDGGDGDEGGEDGNGDGGASESGSEESDSSDGSPSSDGSDSSDESESGVTKQIADESPTINLSQKREPTSWNLDEFIKSIPTTATKQKTPSEQSENYLVRIDLSRLKRIPGTKVPTPTIGSNSILTAKSLKHEADAEKDKTKQAIKYLESAMYFVLHGYELEISSKNTGYYTDVIPLFRHVIRQSMPNNLDNPDNMTNLKIHALALKCLSLVYSRLYKSRQLELVEATKVINSHQDNSPIQQIDKDLIGVRPQLFSAYKRQTAIFNNLRYAHDNWHHVELLCDQHPALRIFFSTIESNCGPLSMISPFSKLMEHVQCGLKLLKTS